MQVAQSASFGVYLKERRRELDLTQEMLAERASCSVETIKKIEAGNLRPSRLLASKLAESLGIATSEQAAFIDWARKATTAAFLGKTASQAGENHIPAPPTPLIGRLAERMQLGTMLRRPDIRLVTISGTGGTGKTRLAIQVALDLQPAFADGVFFGSLAAISDPGLLVNTLAGLFDLRGDTNQALVTSLHNFLRAKNMLLVLDNFEQIIAAAPQVAELLASAPSLKILVTSRAALRLRGEKEFPLDPFALPDLQNLPPLSELANYEALRLFVERANDVQPAFALTEANKVAVATICHRLDGLPLAIELAAARVKLLPPPVLLTRLTSRLELLTGGAADLPPRQRTLRDAIGWSYDLLSPDQQKLFRYLTVFTGGCSLDAAENIAGVEAAISPTPLEKLAGLVNNSLLRQLEQPEGTSRFYMLETVREYALEQLFERGEETAARTAHLTWCLQLAEQIKGEIPNDQSWLDSLEIEQDNMRAALEWSLANESENASGLKLAASLWSFWEKRGSMMDGYRWLERFLATPAAQTQTLTRAHALYAIGSLSWTLAEYAKGHGYLIESLKLYQQLGDVHGVAMLQSNLGGFLLQQGGFEQARELLEQSEATARTNNYNWILAWSLYWRGYLEIRKNNQAAAQPYFAEALNLMRQSGNQREIAAMLISLSHATSLAGSYTAALSYSEEGLALLRELNDPYEIRQGLHFLAYANYRDGHFTRAAELFAETAQRAGECGDTISHAWSLNHCADVLRCLADDATAAGLYEQSLRLFEQENHREGMAAVQHNLGYIFLHQGRLAEAAVQFKEGLRLFNSLSYRWCMADCLTGIAGVLVFGGKAEAAARLLAAVHQLHNAVDPTGASLDQANRLELEIIEAEIKRNLDEKTLEAATASGRTSSLDEIIKFVFSI